jgi:hypothetical protein
MREAEYGNGVDHDDVPVEGGKLHERFPKIRCAVLGVYVSIRLAAYE